MMMSLKQEFVDSIRKLDKTGEDDNDFAIDSTKTSLDSKTPEVTIPVNLTKPSPTVVFSKYLTDGAKTFEAYYKKEYETNKDALMIKSSNSAEIPAIPLYFVSACQARKKNKKYDIYYQTWKKLADEKAKDINDNGGEGVVIMSPPEETKYYNTQKGWVDWMDEAPNHTVPNKVKYIVKDGVFLMSSFHINIVFFFEGLIYSLGYGLDQDDPSHTNSFLATLEAAIKKNCYW